MKYNVEVMESAHDFICSLSPKLRAKALRAIELLQEFDFKLCEPHSKTLAGTGGLKELRVKVGTDICRIFYFHHKNTLCVNIDVASNKEVNYGIFKSSDGRRVKKSLAA